LFFQLRDLLISFECGNPNARETPATPAQGAKDTFDSAFFQATRSRTMAAVKVATVGDFVQWSSCAAWCVKMGHPESESLGSTKRY